MKKILSAGLITTAAIVFGAATGLGRSPPWAPAHGWRKQHDPEYLGYTGSKWQRDYGVLGGHCDSAAVGAVIGGAAGGVIGSRVGDESTRPLAILVGSVIGAMVGARIGAEMDPSDRACMGHALELAGERRTVVWTNAATGVRYRLTPTRNLGRQDAPCREFTARVERGRHRESVRGTACRAGNGEWSVKADTLVKSALAALLGAAP